MRALFSKGFLWTLMLSLASASASAETALLSGMFDGSEATLPPILEAGEGQAAGPQPERGIREISLRVNISGIYRLSDLNWFGWYYNTASVVIHVYADRFEPGAQPLAKEGEYGDGFRLEAGRDYRVVLQHCCERLEQAWAIAVQGPGSIQSDARAELPDFSAGELTEAGPTMTSECGSLWGSWGWGPVRDAPYQQVGPIRVRRAGLHYYTSLGSSGFDEVTTCLSVYSAPVDPAAPEANRVALIDAGYSLWLEPGRDYYLVSHWYGFAGTRRHGSFTLLLTEPAPLRLNPGLSGAWYDPDHPGQGYFLSVFDNANEVLLANFGFAPVSSPGAAETRQLWTTAQGPFVGNRAQLDVYLTEDGAFDTPAPSPQSRRVGTLELEITDCAHGRLSYQPLEGAPPGLDLPSQTAIRRLADDSVQLCEAQFAGPDQVGPW